MKVLVACEESQEVCKAFRALGHEAYSCDIQPCSGGHPEWHLQVNALELLKMKWDLIIAHPPCTYLTAAGAVRLFNSDHQIKDKKRDEKGWEAAEFFRSFLIADCDRIAIENPVPLKRYGLPKYSQIIEPYFFGEPCLGIEKKNTELVGDSICFDCVKVENINGLEKTIPINDMLARAEAAEVRCETLEKMVKEYQETIIPGFREAAEKAERERDAAVEQIRGDCEKCAHYRVTWNGCTPDFECPLSDTCLNRDLWEWAGAAKEE